MQSEQLNAPVDGATFPWMHLWFLYYLLVFYAGALVLRAAAGVVDRAGRLSIALDSVIRFCLSGVWGAAVVGLPLAVYFYALDGWPSWTGLLAPLALWPQTHSVLSYGIPSLSAGSRTGRSIACSRWRSGGRSSPCSPSR